MAPLGHNELKQFQSYLKFNLIIDPWIALEDASNYENTIYDIKKPPWILKILCVHGLYRNKGVILSLYKFLLSR